MKLVVSNEAGTPILKHQFLVIWMSINTRYRRGGRGRSDRDLALGDPPGDGVFNAGDSDGRIQVKVKGTFPHPLGPGGSFTLPDAWPTLANALADDSDSNPDNNAGRWDIHDDLTKAEGHVGGFLRTDAGALRHRRSGQLPNGQESAGPFSRVYGDGIIGARPVRSARARARC